MKRVTKQNVFKLFNGMCLSKDGVEMIILSSDYDTVRGGYYYHSTEIDEDGNLFEIVESGNFITWRELIGYYFY